jgi:hypothetical protein
MPAGTGTPGTNQNGPLVGPAHSPGEIVSVGTPLSNNAPAPVVDTALQTMFVQRAFDTAVKAPLRDRLIWDQFATVKPTRQTHNGAPVRMFFGEDIPEAGSEIPLLENLDVDSVSFSARAIDLEPREYGRAVTRTRLLNARSMVNIDPQIVDRVAFDAARAQNSLARARFVAGLAGINYVGPAGTIASVPASIPAAATGDTWLSTTTLQIAIALLQDQNVMGFRGDDTYILLCNTKGVQHLKNERDTGGFRYVTARNEGTAGNSIFRGQVGMVEGADVVYSNTVPVGQAYLIGRDALAKVHSNMEGYSAQPSTVVSPIVDKLRRFLSWGWLHYVDYSIFDTRAIVKIEHADKFRPAGADNVGAAAGDPVEVTGW